MSTTMLYLQLLTFGKAQQLDVLVINKMADVRCQRTFQIKTFTQDYQSYCIYVSTKQLTVFKNMAIILVQIVRMTLDAFSCEKSVSAKFHRSRNGFAPQVCAGHECSCDQLV